jgi:hypothetical protein
LAALAAWLYWKIRSLTKEALTQAASPLLDAEVKVHAIEPTDRPTTSSLFDVDDDDDEFDPSLDAAEAWQTEGDFFWIDCTIAPRDPSAAWHASVLTLVPANWEGAIGEFSEAIGPLHTVELVGADGRRPLADGEDVLTGSKRVRLLMAAPPGHSQVKLAYFGATFGDIKLPAPVVTGTR